ncbi:MAG: RNA 3'-terminal phosphate cyclase [Armatimonadota bacterium]|nr:RNA 3'-terminal phosphate cyclase [Armatimonadota bacterium]MDR7444129.1 RNA 3'-terminal phosphate cyclase [Armatimonadota bacterium]MDR7569546.1 RNA 3'-terminal phosphate cyclase [Armatimonadota bacterium]MDR7613578.1 RNA 3'-terminal phosphate cyclase [Armatimonadota bacterium]
MVEVDGAQRSGSGTIVRTAAALAVLLGQDLRVTNVRARREEPGLRPQHLRALEAVAELCAARLDGARVGSREFTLHAARRPEGGRYHWDIGSAGSTTLLALTVLPVAAFASEPSVFRIEGGLFQDFAPSAFHLQHVVLPTLRRMGLRAEVEILRPGYVPKGGGILEVRVEPVEGALRPLRLLEQGQVTRVWGIALSSHLQQRRVSERMAERCAAKLRRAGLWPEIEVIYDRTALQPGAALAVFAETSTGCRLGADRAGVSGRPSEAIADEVARMLLLDLRSGATVDRHLADQLVVYAALAEGTTEFVVPEVTDHVTTNLWLAQEIAHAEVSLDHRRVRIRGIGYRR